MEEDSGRIDCPDVKDDYADEVRATFFDSVTGLFNHDYFKLTLEREIFRSQRYGDPLTLALIEVDSYESYDNVNDRFWLLKDLSKVILENIRQSDLGARFGRNTFAVILPGSDSSTCMIALDRIRDAANSSFKVHETISIGVVSFSKDIKNSDELVERAQVALSQAKMHGGDRVYRLEKKGVLKEKDNARVLVVDDDLMNTMLLKRLLLPLDYQVITSSSGQETLAIVDNEDIDLILLDVMMPGMDGYEVCRILKQNENTRLIPIIFVTALEDKDSKIRGIEAGADDFITKPPNALELTTRVRSLIKVKNLNSNLISIENVLFSLANAVEANDVYTQGHTQRVSHTAYDIGNRMGLSPRELNAIRIGGMLHDIGKIGISPDILHKPGPLNEEEWRIMKRHPEIGFNICLPLKDTLKEALDIIRHHHEKLDGSGYPDNLEGEAVTIIARVMAVADIYDALTSDRPYRLAMPKEKAFGILRDEASQGKIDEVIVEHLLEMIG
ncbi:MAG TPA: response regulator [Deltaproteobacteria bacterium]|nr:response regulator [Deltaproteobacteria bacterium]